MGHWASTYAGQLVGHIAEGVLVTDSAFAIQYANQQAATLLGAETPDALAGKQLDGPSGGAGIQFEPGFVDPEGAGVDGPYRISAPGLRGVDVDVTFVPVEQPTPSWLILLSRSRAPQEFDQVFFQSEKLAAMDNIVAGVAHELNNPMTAILGYAELLLATERDPKRKRRIGLIAEEADRCGKIIGNMLSFTRSFGNDFEEGSVGALLEEIVSLRAYQMRVDGIELHTDIARDIPPGLIQPSAIRRLFLNILHNAHQALLEVPESQRAFWATARCEAETVHIELADSGPGVSEEVRYRIFDPFFTTRDLGEGMGLGLSVAFGVVHEHHGNIWMEPRVGGGTSIRIELPVRMME